ncbi:MAG TPA: prenyltransferase/squalene oxidase repeat-containing protein, partial [Gemmataceae bacterium]|nr:prenyltransferase/squalene oxidase repeat-containing protein [Gemmataceae bacterium]
MIVRSFALALLAVSTSLLGPDGTRPVPVPATKAPAARQAHLHPKPPMPVPPEKLQAAIDRGLAFLLADQNKDGSWGTPGRTKQLNIIAGIGSHQAFRTAVTALCVSALIEVGGDSTPVRQAIERGEAFLFRELPRVRRDNEMLIYNIWAHGYGIQALVHMDRRLPNDKERHNRIVELIRGQYDRLRRYESAEGGWGYYDFDAGSQRPASSSTSFMDAAVLEAMYEAKTLGVPPPPKLLKHALAALRMQRKPDFSYLYGTYTWMKPMWGINRPGGSLGRSQACNLALRLWGDKTVTDQVLKTWLDRLITRNGWLSLGRKRPIPHESFFMVAGYFYYFGHYYASLCIEQLPPAERPFYQDHLAHILMDLQEKDGSWWDYPLYNYHQQYGTAFALMTL